MLKIVPLGGLGEIGLNSMIFEHSGERILVDCGLMFPRADQLGVEVVVPDFAPLLAAPDSLKAVVLTHAHEDHLGALPWLLRRLQVPVYGTPFTIALARHKLEEAEFDADLREIGPGSPFTIGDFTVEPLQVTHSVPDAVGLAITTPSGTAIHTGDFKLDDSPIDEKPTDLARLEALGERGVSLLLSDSTNSEVAGTTPSESRVRDTFARLISEAQGRVIITLFSSHLHRVQHAIDLARQHGRRAVLLGRSLQRNVQLARETGALRVPEDAVMPYDLVDSLLPRQQLILCTGAQAEPRAALFTLLTESRERRIGPDDLVILSSRVIPGNEQAVSMLLNRLFASGARVAYAGNEPGVHVSGHAAQDEQRRMLELVRPRHFVPIHGELRHLHRHRALARAAGVPDERSFIITDGDQLGIDQHGAHALGQVAVGRHLMRRESFSAVDEVVLAERRMIAESGLVTCVVALAHGGSSVLAGPSLQGKGLAADELAAMELATDGARLALWELDARARADDEAVRQALVSGTRKTFKQLLGRAPVVTPIVLRIPGS